MRRSRLFSYLQHVAVLGAASLAVLVTTLGVGATAGCGVDDVALFDETDGAGGVTTASGAAAPMGAGAAGVGGAGSSACTVSDECASGFCVDGFCCDSACDAACVACAAALTGQPNGVCEAVTSGTDPDRECAAQSAETCGADGTGCNGDATAPGCTLHDDTTVCAAATCSAGERTENLCDGEGSCVAAASVSCAPYVCADETSCGTSCSEHADCAAGNYCDGTACVPQLTNGEPCASADQCESGECVDTVCCDDVCDGECESCLGGETDGSDGTCAAVTAPTDPALECGFLQACNGAGACADCVTQSVKLESRLDILLLLDRSGSMGFNDPTAMMPKWDIVENALNVLFVDSGWEGVNVGINFFPPTGVGDPASCDVDEYSPLQVSVAALTSEAATLSAAIEAQNPQADHTPIEGALDGTLAAAVAHQMANPSRKVIVVLATDGAPNACDTDEDNIATLAMLAFDNDGIRTYTIAVAGAVLSLLDKIAMAGGTAEAHDITGDTALFVSTMESIRADAFDCTFDISDLSMVDAAAANITLTPDGGTPTLVPRVADVGACGTDPGYFFDNPADPMSVGLCHASCDSVVAAPDTSIDLVLGCPST